MGAAVGGLVLGGVVQLALVATAAAQPAPASFARPTLPARGRQETLLSVPAFGRWAVAVTSPQGTALQIVDRLAGPGRVAGTAGKDDGRVDVFLERGDYKVVTWASEKGSGDAELRVHGFVERNGSDPPLLVELKPVDTTLDDLEQRSWWLQVETRRTVLLEAGGRNLADLRLWTNGDWLVDADPVCEVTTPRPARAMKVCRLATALEPGVYLLTAYGGVSQPQAEESGEHPLHLRFGVPRLGAAGRGRRTMSPFGVDRWLVPGSATYFRLELPEARPATLRIGADPDRAFDAEATRASIDKNALVPVAESEVTSTTGDRVVTVTAAAGEPYVLQHFDRGSAYFGGRRWVLPHPGKYWVSTVHAGDPADSVDATAILTMLDRRKADDAHDMPIHTQAVEVAPGTPWVRRCNLLDTTTVFLRVRRGGRYVVDARGIEAKFRIEPFLTYFPPGYERPALQGAGSIWDLEPGIHVLTAEPVKKGILDVAVRAADDPGAAEIFARLRTGGGTSLRPAAQFPLVRVAPGRSYAVYLNQQASVATGLVLRPLPLDLADPLPVMQRPGETIAVRIRQRTEGTLTAEAEDGSLLAVSVDGGPALESQRVSPGSHRVVVQPARAVTVQYTLVVRPVRLEATTPLPSLPDTAHPAPPDFPVLTDAQPRFFDLERTAKTTFLVHATVPALYRLQTTGLLATEGRLRTRTVTAFDRAAVNGVGRNFFIEQYLREGDYQVTVATQGQSRGHLGLTLERTELLDGGELAAGNVARRALPAGAAIAYRFTIPEDGDYRVRSFGPGSTFRCRLEDADGWPIEQPNVPADLTRRFERGTYRLVSLPEPIDTRRLTLVERVRTPRRFQGHGPHRLPLAVGIDHVWTEPATGEPRTPDAWRFVLPAPAEVRIELDGEMEGTLVRAGDKNAETVASLSPGRGFSGTLAAGRYRLDARSARPNNHAPYRVGVFPEPLVAGLEREITAPADVAVSVGRDGLVQLGSFGAADVRARLVDTAGRVVADDDDGADDWNFQIQTRASAGRYVLHVDPVGSSSATTTVSMRAPDEAAARSLSVPVRTDVALTGGVAVYPIAVPAGAELLVVAASAPESVGCALESAGLDGVFRTAASQSGRSTRLVVPLAPDMTWRLRLWSADGRAMRVHLVVAVPTLLHVTERELHDGTALVPVAGVDPPIAVGAVQVGHSGVFRLADDAVWASSARGVACAPSPGGVVAARGPTLWLVAGEGVQKVSGSRVVLGSGEHVQVWADGERFIACDLAEGTGGPVLAMATSLAASPAVRFASPAARGMAVGLRAAAAVSVGGADRQVEVWVPGATSPTAVVLEQWSFAPPASDTATGAAWDAVLGGVGARALALPAGAKRMRLVLDQATVAVLSDGDRVESVHWSGNEPFEETLDTSASRLTVLHVRDGEDPLHADWLPLAAADVSPPVAPGMPWERALVRGGLVRLAVACTGGEPCSAHVRGADTMAVLVGSDGHVARGRDLAVGGARATLLVRHAPGLVLAWVDRVGQEAQDLWGRTAPAEATAVSPPAIVPLAGAAQTLQLEPSGPVMLHLRTATPVVTQLVRGVEPPEIDVHAAGAILDAYVAGGPVRLALRAAGGGTLWGSAEITTSPVVPIGEGLGPEQLLPAGGTTLFSFEVATEREIGVGVRAMPDVVDLTLLDAHAKRLGTGVVQMQKLEAGTYLLAVHAPPGRGPVAIRPAVAGIEPPGTGPPEDVVREYVTMEAESP